MALYLSPLVDVNEIDLTTTIPAVATSIGVLAIRDPYKGPELKKQLITNVDELIEHFGEPTSGSYRDILAGTGYLKYGNKLYCTAVMAPSATFAGWHGNIPTSGSPPAVSGGAFTGATGFTTNNAYILSDFASEDPDEFGNESAVFDPGSGDYGSNISLIAATRGKWGNYIKVALVGSDTYDNVRKGNTISGMSTELYDDIEAVDVSFDSSSNTEFLVIVKAADQDQIENVSPTYFIKEAWLVSVNDRKIDDEGTNIFCERFLAQNSKYVRMAISASTLKANTDMSGLYMNDYASFTGGQNTASTNVTDADIITAYELYEDPETIDINLLIDADKSDTVKQTLIQIAEDRKDTMAILDVPQSMVVNNRGNEATDVRDYRLGTGGGRTLNENTSYASLYGNWLEIYDKWNGRYRWIPASGHVTGIYANTDDVSDPWFAPAGLNRAIITNIRKLAFNPNLAKRDILYKNGINPIVSFAGQGKVIWGQKTMLDKNSAFNRVNVRRLFIVLEKAIATAVKYFLFEPNDTFTRLQLINMIEPFLRDVRSRRGIYDFLIVCDSTNNTAERIDRNELWCDIYIKPTRAAEFIVLNFIATKTGASFTELVAAGQTPTSGI
jgi:phage tail sheath protein FI